ncbi:MAG: hypothetical protein N2422_00360 [Rhodobacteraceae bacterium]|nr:hypothetical protein [Paracoccaceae bacterium]
MRAGMAVVALAVLLAAPVAAKDWTRLDGAEVRRALSERKLQYEDGSWQTFANDGGTSMQRGRYMRGRWEVRGDSYCALWPPSQDWACYRVERNARQQSLRFTAQDGQVVVGIYVD